MASLCQVWGGTQDYAIKSLQIIQNKAGRLVTGCSWFTPTATLLRKCGWLSVRQLIAYHTLLTVHSTVTSGAPQYIHEKICTQTKHNTRQRVKFSDKFTGKSERTRDSF